VREGKTHREVAGILGVRRQVVGRWVQRCREGGAAALKARKRGRPPGARLKPHQAATIVRLISTRCPDQLQLPFALWTRAAVRDLIARRVGLHLSGWTVGRYLRHWGLTPQKPIRRAYERDPAAVRRWLKKPYPAIRALARRARATIYWGDEPGMRSDHQAGRSWGRRGQPPVVPGTGKRFRCNMISALTNRGTLAFMVFSGRFTQRVFVVFLRRLLRHARRPLFLILDSHPVHLGAHTQQWVKRHRQQLRLFFLPSYSPELNPDELLNQAVKTNAVGRQRPRTAPELVGNVRRFMWSTQRRPHKVRRYFRHPSVRYAS
jgi:transposase